MKPVAPGSEGFSLIEMLVALAIFALVGVAGLTLLDTVLRSNRATDGRLDAISALDRGLTVISRDLAASVPGTLVLDGEGLSLLRGGPDNLSLSFAMDEAGALLRSISRAGSSDVVEQVLFAGVEATDWQILDGQRQWHDTWPPATGSPGQALAAQLTLTLVASGELRRLVELPQTVPAR